MPAEQFRQVMRHRATGRTAINYQWRGPGILGRERRQFVRGTIGRERNGARGYVRLDKNEPTRASTKTLLIIFEQRFYLRPGEGGQIVFGRPEPGSQAGRGSNPKPSRFDCRKRRLPGVCRRSLQGQGYRFINVARSRTRLPAAPQHG